MAFWSGKVEGWRAEGRRAGGPEGRRAGGLEGWRAGGLDGRRAKGLEGEGAEGAQKPNKTTHFVANVPKNTIKQDILALEGRRAEGDKTLSRLKLIGLTPGATAQQRTFLPCQEKKLAEEGSTKSGILERNEDRKDSLLKIPLSDQEKSWSASGIQLTS
eukprot:6201620-Amphidinium_carterae.1